MLALLAFAAPAIGQDRAADGADGAPPFVIRPGDVLRIRVWPDTALSGDFAVEETGSVYLPVLGEVRVAGLAIDAVRAELRERYGQVSKSPVVTVTPLVPVSVLGAVERPGLYRVDPTQSLFDAISLAGGLRRDANAKAVRLIRDGHVIEVNAKRALETGDAVLALALRSGDRIVVPERAATIFAPQNIVYLLQSVVLLLTMVQLGR